MNNFQHHNQNTKSQKTQGNQVSQSQSSPLMQIVGAVLPTLLEHFTGQKIASGSPNANAMETQLILSQVLTLQQQIITSQQELARRVINLENRASQQFNGLFQQVKNLGSIRLTHDRERKQIDLNRTSENYENEN